MEKPPLAPEEPSEEESSFDSREGIPRTRRPITFITRTKPHTTRRGIVITAPLCLPRATIDSVSARMFTRSSASVFETGRSLARSHHGESIERTYRSAVRRRRASPELEPRFCGRSPLEGRRTCRREEASLRFNRSTCGEGKPVRENRFARRVARRTAKLSNEPRTEHGVRPGVRGLAPLRQAR
ncbi:hypothetical protein X777_04506 [Ooceraea biroi]|uniref:Uncharacterized protein n=1 Tax=Ooceraea biroi TaxID=2015173 RepID=A0A026WH97_OOCBI|nr:hypothetical protein X777_04506 [Ooceraea biroi]